VSLEHENEFHTRSIDFKSLSTWISIAFYSPSPNEHDVNRSAKGTGRIPLRDKSAKPGSKGAIADFSGPFRSENVPGIAGQFGSSVRNLYLRGLVGGEGGIRTRGTAHDLSGEIVAEMARFSASELPHG
jgi:hypothetical protein